MSSSCTKCAITVAGKFCEECGQKKEEVVHCGATRTGKFCNDCGTLLAALKQEKKYCFVLNNYEFPNAAHILGYRNGEDANLLGYKKDSAKIRTTFESLGFVVDEKPNSETRDEMLNCVKKKWLKEKDFFVTECVAVFILSHGGEHGVLYACDGSRVHIDEIRRMFSSCDKLKEVPKLFFVQACRGSDTPESVRAPETEFRKSAVQVTTESKFRDSFIYYCTHEGYAGFVSGSGSVFVSKLCEVINEFGKTWKLWDIVTKTNKVVSETSFQYQSTVVAQCPEAVFSLSSHVNLWNPTGNVDEGTQSSVESIHLSERNPCYIISNAECGTHKSACRHFKECKEVAYKTFSELNFNVREKDDLKLKELETMFKDLKSGKAKNIEGSECLVFVVLSCGGLNDNSPIIYGSDGLFYSIDTMVKKTMDCKGLADKPKVFFMILKKCSREEFRKSGEDNNELIKQWKAHGTDTFIYYIVLENENHTWFMTELCYVLVEYSKLGLHLGDVVNEVNKRMFNTYDTESAEKQTPELCSTLTKLLHFRHVGACPQEDVIQKVGLVLEQEVEPQIVVQQLKAEKNLEESSVKMQGSEKIGTAVATNIVMDGMVITYTEESDEDEHDSTNDDNGNDNDECDSKVHDDIIGDTGFGAEKPKFGASLSYDNSRPPEYWYSRTSSKSFDNCMSPLLVKDQVNRQGAICLPGVLDKDLCGRQVVTHDGHPPEELQNIAVVSSTTHNLLAGNPPQFINDSTSTASQSNSSAGLVQEQMYENEAANHTIASREIATENFASDNTSASDNRSQTSYIYLSQLKFQQRKQIFTMLAHGQNSWNDFGHLLVERHGDAFNVTKEEIDHLSLSKGSPAAAFLEQLSVQHTDVTLQQFSEIAKGNQRMDIYRRILSWSEPAGQKLCEISHQKKKYLIQLLDKKVSSNWRDFAAEFNFSTKEIRNIKETAETNRQDPAELLLELIDEKCDEFKLSDFYDILVKITRMDVAAVVKKILSTDGRVPNTLFEDGLR